MIDEFLQPNNSRNAFLEQNSLYLFQVFIDIYFIKLVQHLSSFGICSSGAIREKQTEK